MNKERLLKLAKFLREYVQDNWFDLHVFCDLGFERMECGTAACALGWSPVALKDEGLNLYNKESDVYFELNGIKYHNFNAAEKLFDINEAQVEALFTPHSYHYNKQTRLDVAERIEEFVESDGDISDYKTCDNDYDDYDDYNYDEYDEYHDDDDD